MASHRRSVVVPLGSDAREALLAAIASTPGFDAVPGPTEAGAPLAEARVEGARLTLSNREGAPVMHPAPRKKALGHLGRDLRRMAHAAALRALEGTGLDGVAQGDVELAWGVDGPTEALPLPSVGATLSPGDALYFRLTNRSARPLYVHLFHLRISDAVTCLSGDRFPSGILLAPGSTQRLSAHDIPALIYAWPGSVPGNVARPEQWLVIATLRPIDLRPLAQPGVGAAGPIGLDLARCGVDEAVLTRRVIFFASPRRLARGVATFLRDERPGLSRPSPSDGMRAFSAGLESRRGGSGRIAVVLHELIVHKNRAIFGANIRVDALFVTPNSGAPSYTAGTMRFPNVKDGDRLPLDQVLLYLGPARDLIDVCLWVSRDRTNSLALSDLLAAEANSEEVKTAVGTLAAIAVAAPQAALVVGGIAAAATLANVCYRLLSKAVGDSVGVYRTSLLEMDDFRQGRHPPEGLLRAQDFSFRFDVREAD